MTAEFQDEKELEALWKLAQRGLRESFARRTEDCPPLWKLVRYLLASKMKENKPLSEDLQVLRRHRAFCGYCARRHRILQDALLRGKSLLGLREVVAAAAKAGEFGKALLEELGEGIAQAIDARLRPQVAPITLGEKRLELRAQVLDSEGQPTDEEALLQIEEGPEVHAGEFLLTLKAESRYEGHTAIVAISVDDEPGVSLELGSAVIENGVASIAVRVEALGLQFEPNIPPELLVVTLKAP